MRVLAVNSGGASVRFALYDMGAQGEQRVLSAAYEGIGYSMGRASASDAAGKSLFDRGESIPSHDAALMRFWDWFAGSFPALRPEAVGHRVVHGSSSSREPELIDDGLLEQMGRRASSDPAQAERYLRVVVRLRELLPQVRAFACFDTALHRSMPAVAQRYALPRELYDQGVVRLGTHGLSCESVLESLARDAGRSTALGRVVVAHLGCNSSLSAFKGGSSLECTAGFPAGGGIMSGSRPGELGVGVLLHVMEGRGMTPSELGNILNRQSGLLGVSKISRDMRELLQLAETNPNASEAVELYCYESRKQLGALLAVLGGVDTLVFTGGVGCNAPRIRRAVCEGMAYAGLKLDPARNRQGLPVISADTSSASIRIIASNEELMIARATAAAAAP